MHSVKSLISFAVPAVAATGLLGILFWLFQRKKPPGQRKLTEPPDKITTKQNSDISVSGDTVVKDGGGDCRMESNLSPSGDRGKKAMVEVSGDLNAGCIASLGGGDNLEKVNVPSVVSGNRVDIADTLELVDEHIHNTVADTCSATPSQAASDSNKTSDKSNLHEDIDPAIAKVGEQLVEQTIKEAIAVCVGNRCEEVSAKGQAENDVDVSTVVELSSVATVTVAEPIVDTEHDETTENTSILQSQIEEQMVMSSTENHLHSEPTNASLDSSDLKENTSETHNSEDTDMVNSLESQIILENAIISENSLPSLNCETHRLNGTPECVATSVSDANEQLENNLQMKPKSCHSDIVNDPHLVTASNDCDAKSSQQCVEKTDCTTDSNVSKDAEKNAPTNVLRHVNGGNRSKDDTNRHVDVPSGEQLSNGDVSTNCDNTSEASNDSGKGSSLPGSANSPPLLDEERVFEFNIPSDMCGLFIGTRGKTIKTLRDQSGARLRLRNNPYTPDFQICVVEGPQSAIDRALNIIRRKFPSIKYPGMDMAPLDQGQGQGQGQGRPSGNGGGNPVLVPEIMQLSLPEGVSVDVVVSSIVDAGRLFVQQPTHPTFTSLERLNTCMGSCYIQDGVVPDIPRPIETGVICAAPMLNGWYRAQIMVDYEALGECDIKYVDYGGYSRISDQCLKQIRSDFMTLPFQAIECYLANITALQNETYFSSEAAAVLEELTQGKLLQAQVVGRADDGIPYVHIYQINGNSSAIMVNRELVNRGVCRWIEILS